MKKIIICFIILIPFAFFIFFTGWTQFKIKNGTVGIVISKTGGICQKPVSWGKFSWHWEFLFPTNAELKIFDLKPYYLTQTVSNTLPSSETYSLIFDTPPDFSYEFSFNTAAVVSAEDILELLKHNLITDQKTLEKYIETAFSSLTSSAVSYFLKEATNDVFFNIKKSSNNNLLKSLDAAVNYPYINFQNFTVTSAKFPDYSLYNQAKKYYLSSMESNKNTEEKENTPISIEKLKFNIFNK